MTVTGPGPALLLREADASAVRCRAPQAQDRRVRRVRRRRGQALQGPGRLLLDLQRAEPRKNWLTPQFRSAAASARSTTRRAIYRKLCIAGYKSIAKFDPARAQPRAVRRDGRHQRAAAVPPRRAVPRRAAASRSAAQARKATAARAGSKKLNIGGFAIHPYNPGGNGTPRSRRRTQDGAPDRLPAPPAPPDRRRRAPRAASPAAAASTSPSSASRPSRRTALERDARRAGAVHQRVRPALLRRPPGEDGGPVRAHRRARRRTSSTSACASRAASDKPSYDAYRLPIVVTRRSANSVEVYGQSRPGGASTVAIQSQAAGGQFTTVKNVRTNTRGMFKLNISEGRAPAEVAPERHERETGETITPRGQGRQEAQLLQELSLAPEIRAAPGGRPMGGRRRSR